MRGDETITGRKAVNSGRDAILDAAEQIFGMHGFDGGSMSQIAGRAEVAQSLLHYHYKTKDLLYEAVFERRAMTIRIVRQQRLTELFEGRAKVTIEQVLGVLFMSLEELLGEKRVDLKFYVQMLAEVTLSGSARSIGIVKKLYDPSAEQFIQAFRKILPELSREDAVWAYLFAIGARMQAHAPSDRASRLGAGRKTDRSSYKLLVPFVAAGIRGLLKDKRSG
jgi:AcrR family transcriptional regulator